MAVTVTECDVRTFVGMGVPETELAIVLRSMERRPANGKAARPLRNEQRSGTARFRKNLDMNKSLPEQSANINILLAPEAFWARVL